MLSFHEFAEKLRQKRIKTKDNPTAGGFVMSKDGHVWALVMDVELFYDTGTSIVPAGIVPMFYVDTDQDERSPEAQLIRGGVWESYECGWLVLSIKGHAIQLAKVNPSERNDLDQGWVTDAGQIVLKRE